MRIAECLEEARVKQVAQLLAACIVFEAGFLFAHLRIYANESPVPLSLSRDPRVMFVLWRLFQGPNTQLIRRILRAISMWKKTCAYGVELRRMLPRS